MPELVSTLCTFLVLAPLALMPGMGEFLFMPLTLAVAFAMCSAYILSRTLVPTCSAAWLSGHGHGHGDGHGHDRHETAANGFNGERQTVNGRRPGVVARAFARWERMVDGMFEAYARGLAVLLRHRLLVVGIGFGCSGGHARRVLADHAPRFLPRGRRRRVRDVRPGPERHADRADRGEGRHARGVHQEDDPRARPGADRLRDRRQRRLVGRLHAQRGPDGRRHQGPAQGAPEQVGPGIRAPRPYRAWPRTRGSRTWTSASTPAAWSAAP